MRQSVRRERQLKLITADLQRYAAEKADDWRDAVKRQICPFCGSGPFTVVAIHVSRVHEINRKELRDLIGVFYTESICDPFHSKSVAERSSRFYSEGHSGIHGSRRGHRKNLSLKARELQREKNAKLTPEARAVGAQALSARRLRESRGRDRLIVELIEAGERYEAIAEQLGLASPTVARVARRNGFGVDGRVRYWESRRGEDTAELREARERMLRNRAERRSAIVAQFRAGVSIPVLAIQHSVTKKTMRELLQGEGESVPDFRKGKGVTMVTISCRFCGSQVEKPLSQVTANAKVPGYTGPYCSWSCGRRAAVQRRNDSHVLPPS